jgi:hypothetical protein
MPLIPGQGAGLFAGLVLIVIYSIAYPLVHRSFAYLQPAAKPIFDEDNKHPAEKNSPKPDSQCGRSRWWSLLRRR